MVNHHPAQSIGQGQRVFTCGHSFHFWVADLLNETANLAGISGHQTVGTSSIGASMALKHWDVPEEQNQAKRALRAGGVDVLTLSCMSGPDDGIRKFAELATECNPNIRITVQELWLPEDRFPFDAASRVRKSVDEFNGSTIADLKKPHEAYFKAMEDYVNALNAALGRQVVFIVPDAQATLALRMMIIAGTAPGLSKQSDLFTDAWGHPSPPLRALSCYCHFSVIYRRSPVGFPVLSILADNPHWGAPLSHALQELAWDAVIRHPLSGLWSESRLEGKRGPRE